MRQRLRIIEVLGRSAGGIGRHVALVLRGLDQRDGFEVDIAGPENLPIQMPKAVHAVEIPNGPVRGHREAIARLREVIAAGDYDVVHAHGLRAGIDAGRAARDLGVPVVLSVHNIVLPQISGRVRAAVYRWAEPLAVARAERVLAASADIAEHLKKRAPRAADRIDVVYLGVGHNPKPRRDAASVRSELGLGANDRLVVTAARLSRQKALDVMLKAVARLPTNVVLAVLGRGELEDELKAVARRLALERQVRWLGFRDDAVDLIAAADVFCLSSVWEACALAAQEAMHLGTPVVSTAVGGMPELIEDRVSGRLVRQGDDAALAAALGDVLAAPEEAESYVRGARARLTDRFSTEGMLERIAEVYREVAT